MATMQTSQTNGRLRGTRARDWAEVQAGNAPQPGDPTKEPFA